MSCNEQLNLASTVNAKREAYVYIRLQESKVGLSKTRYDELVKEAYDTLTQAIKDLLRHQQTCPQCRKTP